MYNVDKPDVREEVTIASETLQLPHSNDKQKLNTRLEHTSTSRKKVPGANQKRSLFQ